MKRSIVSIRITLVLVGITLIGLAIFLAHPSSAVTFGLLAGQRLFPWRLHTLITYSFLPAGVMPWLLSSISLLCSALIAERAIMPWLYGLLFATSSIIGGVVFLVIARRVGGSALLVGSAQVAWGVGGAALLLGWARWKSLPWYGKLYVVWVALSFTGSLIDVFVPRQAVLAISQLAAGVFGVVLATGVQLRQKSATA